MIKRRSFVAAVASLAVTAVVLSVPSAPGAAASTSMYWGFNEYVHPASPHNIDNQVKLGDIKVRRMFVYWGDHHDGVENTQGTYNWTKMDQQWNAVQNAGLTPLIVVQNSPRWARGSDKPGPPDTTHLEAWKTFLRAVVHRYNLDVIAPARPAIAFEIWNEPNLTYSSDPDPISYTKFLKESYNTIKTESTSVKVISAGLSPSDGLGGNQQPLSYLATMLANGAAAAMDGVGMHPYPMKGGAWNVAGFDDMLNGTKQAFTDKGLPQKPIWITEAGVSTSTAVGWPIVPASEQKQADDLLYMIKKAKSDSDVAAMMIHTVNDDPDFWVPVHGNAYTNNGLGVFRSTDPIDNTKTAPKRAACVIAQEFGGTLQC